MLADISYSATTPDAGVLFVRGSIGLANARDVCVVSRDREVTGKSRQLGARIMTPAQLLSR